MKKYLGFAAMALLTSAMLAPQGARADTSSPIGTVRQAAADFNKGDLKGFAALCAPTAYVIDDFAPYQWDGANACAAWAKAVAASLKNQHIVGAIVTFGTPWQVATTGDTAYVVVPASLRMSRNGKPVAENGSVLTAVLKKTGGGWVMTSWSWAQH